MIKTKEELFHEMNKRFVTGPKLSSFESLYPSRNGKKKYLFFVKFENTRSRIKLPGTIGVPGTKVFENKVKKLETKYQKWIDEYTEQMSKGLYSSIGEISLPALSPSEESKNFSEACNEIRTNFGIDMSGFYGPDKKYESQALLKLNNKGISKDAIS